MAEIGMIGAGSWGTALAWLLENNGHHVTIWSAKEGEIEELRETRENRQKLPGVILQEDVSYTVDLKEACSDKDIIVVAVASPYVRSTAKKMKDFVRYGQLIVSVAKGIEEDTLCTLSMIISEEIPQSQTVVLCGPSHAEEVGKGMPTLVVAGSENERDSAYVQDIFMSDVFRVYTSTDPYGMQIGAALKNVIALAAGIMDGVGYGDNTKAALITRGITEISRLGVAAGGEESTFYGLTGVGDLIVTCASTHSRNRTAGFLIGQGKSYDEAMTEVKQVVEGVYSAKSAMQLAKKYNVEVPIIEQVNAVLFEGKDPKEAVFDLMCRDKKGE
ncbi:NAD(P)H-dependent glycerol-3-phosphate dehydrogenase [Lachnospiraceae bacterium C1.1]|nr:NAD(P)H-dependent glycerol-3-phosphate dehydrogenase [Lachnospiraceae bacterium C1.1]